MLKFTAIFRNHPLFISVNANIEIVGNTLQKIFAQEFVITVP